MKSEIIIQCIERTIQGDTKAFEELRLRNFIQPQIKGCILFACNF